MRAATRLARWSLLGGILGAGLVSARASAHTAWVFCTPHRLTGPGEAVVWLSWGDLSPFADPIRHTYIRRFSLCSDKEQRVLPVRPGRSRHRTGVRLTAPGSYVASFELRPLYYVMYTSRADGRMHHHVGPLSDVIRDARSVYVAMRSWQSGKSLIDVGAGDGASRRVLGHALEIVPETAPERSGLGQRLAFRVLAQGKPLGVPAVLNVTRMAAYGRPLRPRPPRRLENGQGEIEVDAPGVWLVCVHLLEPAPAEEKGKCWVRHYSATLVFETPAAPASAPATRRDR